MDIVALLQIFPANTKVHLLGPYKNMELFLGTIPECKRWLKRNPDYDIFPDEGGIWVEAVGNAEISVYLDQLDMEVM